MGQIRVGFQRVSAGSAARQAEEEARESGAPRSMRIQGGSAARAAEEAKRLGLKPRQGASSFSLRAQGGRVVRTDAGASAPAHAGEEAAVSSDSRADLQISDLPQVKAGPLDVSHGVLPPRVSHPPDVMGRLQSFLRGIFRSEDSPQP